LKYKVNLRGIGEVVSVIVPKKPIETEDKKQYEVYVNRKDGTLDRVYRFDKINVISIMECK